MPLEWKHLNWKLTLVGNGGSSYRLIYRWSDPEGEMLTRVHFRYRGELTQNHGALVLLRDMGMAGCRACVGSYDPRRQRSTLVRLAELGLARVRDDDDGGKHLFLSTELGNEVLAAFEDAEQRDATKVVSMNPTGERP